MREYAKIMYHFAKWQLFALPRAITQTAKRYNPQHYITPRYIEPRYIIPLLFSYNFLQFSYNFFFTSLNHYIIKFLPVFHSAPLLYYCINIIIQSYNIVSSFFHFITLNNYHINFLKSETQKTLHFSKWR